MLTMFAHFACTLKGYESISWQTGANEQRWNVAFPSGGYRSLLRTNHVACPLGQSQGTRIFIGVYTSLKMIWYMCAHSKTLENKTAVSMTRFPKIYFEILDERLGRSRRIPGQPSVRRTAFWTTGRKIDSYLTTGKKTIYKPFNYTWCKWHIRRHGG